MMLTLRNQGFLTVFRFPPLQVQESNKQVRLPANTGCQMLVMTQPMRSRRGIKIRHLIPATSRGPREQAACTPHFHCEVQSHSRYLKSSHRPLAGFTDVFIGPHPTMSSEAQTLKRGSLAWLAATTQLCHQGSRFSLIPSCPG